ncbi:hypothetical protein BDW59DRAFT_167246 [Aspergillus cavernicola]|uniref:NAD binding Rossmann fold oxidoreductase n=1 Tax=Aspergillus cavernicola TaxID=176166 RepID=A0ABR4HFX9_9EURO
MKELSFLSIGAGSRGNAYARAISTSTPARIAAVAEPDPYKRRIFGEKYIWGEHNSPNPSQEFESWTEWIDYETKRRSEPDSESKSESGVDGILICTLDETHITILTALSSSNLLDLHVLCEKPLALSLSDCLSVYSTRKHSNTIFSIGHVLRYSPHNLLLRRLVREQKVIGDIVSVEHTEPVGFWHFAHSYVRGNWRRETESGDGSLLTKSCHDVDFLLWLIEAPCYTNFTTTDTTSINGSGTAEYATTTTIDDDESTKPSLKLRSIFSTGHLTQFTPHRKPPAAGSATNCTSCPIERECIYSAIRIYRDNHLYQGKTGWPLKIVCPDIEDYADPKAAEDYLLSTLKEDYDVEEGEGAKGNTLTAEEIADRTWYGRCVWESDNDVCDDQVVVLSWDTIPPPPFNSNSNPNPATQRRKAQANKSPPGITATLHMIAPTESQCTRRGRIYGTSGEITYNSSQITIYTFSTKQTRIIDVPKQSPEEEEAHGGGDYGLARGFVGAVDAVVNKGWGVERAQREFVGCDLEEVVRSHGVVFAAEESRRGEGVVKWEGWWRGMLGTAGI